MGGGYPAVVTAAIEVAQTIKSLQGTAGHDFIRGGDIANNLRGAGGDDILQGNGGKDRLAGGSGADDLAGGDGNDVLTGGGGSDTQAGGAGADRLVVLVPGDSRMAAADLITTFSQSDGDLIDLSAIDGISGGAFDRLVFVGAAALTGKGQIRAEVVGADTIIDMNLSGNATPKCATSCPAC